MPGTTKNTAKHKPAPVLKFLQKQGAAFNISHLETLAGLPFSTLQKAVKGGRGLPPEHAAAVAVALRKLAAAATAAARRTVENREGGISEK